MSSKSYSLRVADILAAQYLTNRRHAKNRYVLTRGGFVACAQCCHVFRERFATLDAWIIKTDCVNRNDKFLKCNVCEQSIFAKDVIKLVLDTKRDRCYNRRAMREV
jgi:hypothetical protein